MMELWIDDRRCDLDSNPSIPIDFDIARMKDVEGEVKDIKKDLDSEN